MIKTGLFEFKDLVKVERSCCKSFISDNNFRIGDWVHLNSGGPDLLVVDVNLNQVTVGWKSNDKT